MDLIQAMDAHLTRLTGYCKPDDPMLLSWTHLITGRVTEQTLTTAQWMERERRRISADPRRFAAVVEEGGKIAIFVDCRTRWCNHTVSEHGIPIGVPDELNEDEEV
ncbi:MAG: hypothetical protein AAB539_01425 [Patescibacteria group bacterium]